MKNMNRRSFIGASMALAGASLVVAENPWRHERGPVDLKFFLFSAKPHVVKALLCLDEKIDSFTIKISHEDSDIREGIFRVAAMKEAAFSTPPGHKTFCSVTIVKTAAIMRLPTYLSVDGDRFVMEVGENPIGFWLPLRDVRALLAG